MLRLWLMGGGRGDGWMGERERGRERAMAREEDGGIVFEG